jgi:hypothetical protein
MSLSSKPIGTPCSNSLPSNVRPVSVESLGLVEHELGKMVDVLDTSSPSGAIGGLYSCSRRSRLILRRIAASVDALSAQSTVRSSLMLLTRSLAMLASSAISLVDAAEVHVTHIGGLKRAVRNPSHATLLRVAAALRVEPGQLVIEADRLREAAREPS